MGLSPGNHSTYKQIDTFTAAGNGTTIDVSLNPMSYFTMSVTATGVVSLWNVILEGSIDGLNFTSLAIHTNLLGSGSLIFPGVNNTPCLYFRARCSSLTLGLGTNIVVTIFGAQQ